MARFTKAKSIFEGDVLFGSGIDIGSISFVEFIMTLEEEYDLEIDVDALDASIKTVGQLYARLSAALRAALFRPIPPDRAAVLPWAGTCFAPKPTAP